MAEFSAAHCPLTIARDPACPNSPPGSVIDTGHQSPRFIPGPSASVLIHVIIRLMIQEIGDTPLVTTVPLLSDISPEEPGLDPLVSPSGHGNESDSDCQIQEGPESDSSKAPASHSLGQPRGKRTARNREVETPTFQDSALA